MPLTANGKIDRVFLMKKAQEKIKEKKDERIIRNFKGITPDVDYENCTTLIDDKILDSFDIVQLYLR